MANSQAMEEMRSEGYVVAPCDRKLTPIITKDLFGFGDVMGYDPLHIKRLILVNACLEDVQAHIKKYLEGGTDKKTGKEFGPNEHLVHLIAMGFDLFIYSFVLRMMRDKDNKLLDRKVYVCRKWQAILSPTGQVSFERVEE